MGPNVKFVSAITDAFSNKKMGVNFFPQKKTKRGGGSEGGLVKDHTFPAFFFCTLPLVNDILQMEWNYKPVFFNFPQNGIGQYFDPVKSQWIP